MAGERRGPVLYVVLLAAVFLPAFTLTVLRLLQPDTGRGVAAVALAPLALVGYAVLALLALLGLVGRRRSARAARRVPAALALLVAVAGIGVHGWWLSPAYRGDRPAPAAGAEPFGVLTLNLEFGGADPDAVLAAARERAVAVLVLVEITPVALARLDERGLAETFPYRQGEAVPGAGGTLVLATGPLSPGERVVDGNGSWATTATLPQGELRIWGVHPNRPSARGDAWRDSLGALHQALRTQEPPDVVAGDFNATADHRRFRDLLATGLRDSAEMVDAGWRPTWPANGRFLRLPRFAQIDHVLVGPALTATDTDRVDVPGTDHSGVWAELAYR